MVGCSSATKLGQLPVEDEEFLLSKSELIKKYPTIDEYEYHWKTKMDYKCGELDITGIDCLLAPLHKEKEPVQYTEGPDESKLPLREDVLNALGEPYRIKGGYGLHAFLAGIFLIVGLEPVYAIAGPFVMYPDPKRSYYFERGNYCMSARFERSPKTMYKSLMMSWQWEEKENTEEKCEEL